MKGFNPKAVKYPLRTMDVGESFHVAEPPRYFAIYVHIRGKHLGRVFRTRARDGGRTVTRVA